MPTTKAPCNSCHGETTHFLLHEDSSTWSKSVEDEFSVEGSDTYRMLKCCGCDSVTLVHFSWFSEETDSHGNPAVKRTYYPPRIKRDIPNWLYHLWVADSDAIASLFKEVYIASNNNCPRLAVMGIRAILEHAMIEKVGDQGTFEKNMDSFEQLGFISKVQRSVLSTVLEAGHATMHRGFAAPKNTLDNIIDITENIIESIYVNEERAQAIQVPPRQKRNKAGKA